MFELRSYRNDYASFLALGLTLIALFACIPELVVAQTTVSTGSIQGVIVDPSSAVVPGARITITNKATGQAISLASTATGTYNSGALIPGDYVVRVEAKGFRTVELPVTVQVDVTAAGNVTLELGQETAVIFVEATSLRVNTEQATVQGVLTAQQIERLPINGRNFLDLAALEPGVQIQDGGNFDPTKEGFSSISFGGRSGRTARIELDGVDISDETVGTTTQNIPVAAIQEFSVAQSSLDLSTELTSSGAVNIVTRSGSNNFHGEGFTYFRDHKYAARYGNADVPFDRQQYGGRFGGAFIKNKLFFFGAYERTVQDYQQAVILPDPFTSLSGSYNSPFHESMLVGRLDWQIKPNWRAFYRWTYDQNNNVAPFILNTWEPFGNRDNTPVQAGGLDATMGNWSHAIRFGYMRFRNGIVDSSNRLTPPGLPTDVNVHIGPFTGCTSVGDVFCSGPNILAPQQTLQRNLQIKYDGSKIYHSHIIRYGVGVNRILGGGFAKFYSLAPAFRSSFTPRNEAKAAAGPFPGGASNPLNWPVSRLRFGNGQGFFTDIPQLGFPAGGQFDTRFAWYIGDSWKAKRNLTISYGLRYVRDTGRSDNDLPPLTLLNQWGPGLGGRVNQPNKNFAPQLGIAWDPWKNGKTSIRAGAGLYYENSVFNNVLFDRAGRLTKGLFFAEANPCPGGSLNLPDGTSIDTSAICGHPIGNSLDLAKQLLVTYQQAVAAAGASANPASLGANLANGANSTGNNFYSPDWQTPRSWQFNAGFEREIKPGTVISVDYVRNVGLHYLLTYDTNHIGDARFLNVAAALNAMNLTNEGFGCPDGSGGINCAIAAGAGIGDYLGNGLDSGKTYLGGTPASLNGLTPDTGAAFPGINPNLGENEMLFPIGRSVYNALQVALRSNKENPAPGIRNISFQVSYALSRFKSEAADQDFLYDSFDFRNTSHFYGPDNLDRTHQFSFGGSFDFPKAFRVSYNGRIATALPLTLLLPGGGDAGAIFTGDWTGDGSVQDHILPGTNIGSFGRDVKVNKLNTVLGNYNNTIAGSLTPAGQALVSAGLFTKDQLAALGGVLQSVPLAPSGQLANDPSLNTGLRFGWVLKPGKVWKSLGETATIEPTVSIFNLFNFAHFDVLGGELNGLALSANGTTGANRTNKFFLGSGVFGFAAPRTFEFGVRVSF